MPICVGYITAGGQHAVIADGDVAGGINSNAGADQDMIADVDMTLLLPQVPGGQRNPAVLCRHHVKESADPNLGPENIDIPRFHEQRAGTEASKVGRNEMLAVPVFEGLKAIF